MAKQQGKPNYRITNGTAAILLALAVLADALSLIPFVGDAVGPIFWVFVAVYLWKIGCGFINTRRLATEMISFIAELIPAVQELPTIIICMSIVIFLIRVEDKTGVKMLGGAKTLKGMRAGEGGLTSEGRTAARSYVSANQDAIRASRREQQQALDEAGPSTANGYTRPRGNIQTLE